MKLGSSPYEQYKVSDNEWCEYLPSVWQEKRVKNIFNLITDLAPDNNDFELLSLYTSIGVKPRKEMEQRGNKSVTTDGYWIVKKGDIIVNKLLAWMGAIGLSEYDGVTSPAYDILRKFNNEVDEKFYTYLFRTEKAQAIFKKYSRGIMDVRLRLYFDKFGAITVPFPPPSEQKAIANYLDTKTAQIERQIDLLTEKAKLYNNLKQSLINETVTRGLDKTVPMKDSGIEWLGEVPEHWEIRRIKDYTYVKGRIGWQGLRSSDFLDQGEFYCVTGTDLVNGSIDWSHCYFVSQDRYEQDKYIQLKIRDLLITKDGTIGKIALIHELPLKATLNSGLFVTRPLKAKYSNEFMYWVLNSSAFRNYIDLTKGGSTIQHLYQNVFERFLYVCPPLPEQKEIAHYLDTKTSQIDKIIETINTQIEKLKELRKTLINDVVTGKIKVV
jgi:type I restriction enzyme S subunit